MIKLIHKTATRSGYEIMGLHDDTDALSIIRQMMFRSAALKTHSNVACKSVFPV
jgi:hypothetical protein